MRVLVSQIPSHIPEIGSVSLQPRKNPQFDPLKHGGLSSEDYFVLSRMDGQASFRTIILETGFAPERAIGIIRRLRECGAFLLPGERPYAPPRAATIPGATDAPGATAPPPTAFGTRPPARALPSAIPSGSPQPQPPGRAPSPRAANPPLSTEEHAAMAASSALVDDDRRAVLALRRVVRTGTYFDLLGVSSSVDRRTLKRAYFQLSKRFHPDRYYGKELGPFGPWLSEIFEQLQRAFAVLDDERLRADYVAALAGRAPARAQPRAQTQQEHAAELFDTACKLELQREFVEALKLFAAVVRVDPTSRRVQRAARCALEAGQLSLAEEYAKKAASLEPSDPSYARLLASVYRAAGKLSEAQTTLEQALSLNTDSTKLVKELQADLDAVRRQLAAPDT